MEKSELETYADDHKTQIVVLNVETQEYGIQIDSVREISEMVSIVRMPKAPYFVEGVINLRNHIVPIIDLHRRFHMMERTDTPATSIIIIEDGESNKVGFIVDEVKEVVGLSIDEIDEKPTLLDESIGSDFMAGIGKLGDRLIILLDINNILKVSSETKD